MLLQKVGRCQSINLIKKIAIIGGPGSGKTRLSDKLHFLFHFPVYHIDEFKFSKDWKRKAKKETLKQIEETIQQEEWILEGNSLLDLDRILQNADFIIFLDFPLSLQLAGIFERFFSSLRKGKLERISVSFFFKTIFFNYMKRPKIVKLLSKNKWMESSIQILKNRSQVCHWLKQIKAKRNFF